MAESDKVTDKKTDKSIVDMDEDELVEYLVDSIDAESTAIYGGREATRALARQLIQKVDRWAYAESRRNETGEARSTETPVGFYRIKPG